MPITYNELRHFVSNGVVVGSSESSVNAASIDVHLSSRFLLERVDSNKTLAVDVANRQSPEFLEVSATDSQPLRMQPGQFLLASTTEVFNLPSNVCALFVMKSSVARCGLDQMNAAWCSPGWSGSALTLELINVLRGHSLLLRPGMPVGQMVFFNVESVPDHMLYSRRGVYNGHREVSRVAAHGGTSAGSL